MQVVCTNFYRMSMCEGGLGSHNSVHLSRVDCDKTKWCTADILIPYERAITLLLWHQQWLVGDAPFPGTTHLFMFHTCTQCACTLAVTRLCRRNVMLTSSCLLLDVLLPLIASPTGTRCHPKRKHWHDWVSKHKLRHVIMVWKVTIQPKI